MSSVFAALSKGEGVTSGLKKVDASQQTHKNPSLRVAAPVPAAPASGTNGPSPTRPAKPPKPHSFQRKPAKTELDGNKWLIVRVKLPKFTLSN